MSRPSFRYAQLPPGQIRLLKVLGGHSFRLSFHIEHFQRERAPPYVALSYTWGQNDAMEHVRIGNESYAVRPNLWQALYEMGRFGEWRYLWVDAICIDQQNTRERNHQVEAMDETYRNATTVVAWLGPTSEVDRAEDWDWRRHLVDLANRPYWSRIWIVQELILAQHVQILCGRHRISWAEFTAALKSQILSPKEKELLNRSIATRFLDVKARPDTRHLASLLRVYYQSGCQDRRDRVFALLNLLPATEREFLLQYFPNYALDADSVLLITLKLLLSSTSEDQQGAELRPDDEIGKAFGLDQTAWMTFLRVSADDVPTSHLLKENLDGAYEVVDRSGYGWSERGSGVVLR